MTDAAYLILAGASDWQQPAVRGQTAPARWHKPGESLAAISRAGNLAVLDQVNTLRQVLGY